MARTLKFAISFAITFLTLAFTLAPLAWSGQELQLLSGDIVFQTSKSAQSYPIMWATKSVYSHVGIVEVRKNKIFVIEAAAGVTRVPLQEWIDRGRFKRFTVMRMGNLSSQQRDAIVAAAKAYMGRPYDIYFTSGNGSIYCSELVALAYQDAGIPVGDWQRIRELDVENILVRGLVRRRWRSHPLCREHRRSLETFEECWELILDDKLISPDGIAADSRLKTVYSNYYP